MKIIFGIIVCILLGAFQILNIYNKFFENINISEIVKSIIWELGNFIIAYMLIKELKEKDD